MRRHRLARVALVATTSLLCLLLIDRIVLHALPLGNIVYRLHPDHLIEYVPDSSKIYIHSSANGGDWVRVRFNRQGYRGKELAALDGAPRVLVYGDSFVAAEFTSLDETFVAQLAGRLSEGLGGPVEAVNAGLVGSGPDQVLRRMPAELAALEPSLVIVALTSANDFGDLIRNKLYQLADDGSLIVRAPDVGAGLRRGLEPSWHAHSGWGLLLRAARRGVAFRVRELRSPAVSLEPPRQVAQRLWERSQGEYTNSVVRGDPVVRNVFDDQYDADVSLTPQARSALHKRRLMEAVLSEIAAVTTQAGVPLLLVAIPSPVDVTEDHYGMVVDWRRFPGYRRDSLTRAVVEPAERLGIPVLDLFGPMRRSEDPSALFYRAGNDHWNSRGQALAADLTAERIVDEGWLDAH